MIDEFVKAWDERKDTLREYIRTHEQSEYDEYEKLVRVLFDVVINPGTENKWDTGRIHVIDDGDYQGTQLFIIPLEVYQPCHWDYVVTCHDYGSCSGCDTLMAISNYEARRPDDSQVDEYMTLLLHLLQSCKTIYEP